MTPSCQWTSATYSSKWRCIRALSTKSRVFCLKHWALMRRARLLPSNLSSNKLCWSSLDLKKIRTLDCSTTFKSPTYANTCTCIETWLGSVCIAWATTASPWTLSSSDSPGLKPLFWFWKINTSISSEASAPKSGTLVRSSMAQVTTLSLLFRTKTSVRCGTQVAIIRCISSATGQALV